MSGRQIIDAHVHTYKTPEIGLQAMQGAGQSGCTGTIEEILAVAQRNGIAKVVMVNMTPVADMIDAGVARLPKDLSGAEMAVQVDKIKVDAINRMIRRNEWSCAVAREHPPLVPFFSIDVIMDAEIMAREIDERVKDGGKGLKLHPASCRYFPNNRAFWPAYKRCEEIGLPVISHSGTFFSGEVHYAQPKFFDEVLAAFPKLTLVLAHMGGGYWDQAVDLAKRYPNVSFDTSAAISGTIGHMNLAKGDEVKLIRQIGVERVMFGSDWPWFDPGRDIEFLKTLDLSDQEKDAIFAGNAARIYKI